MAAFSAAAASGPVPAPRTVSVAGGSASAGATSRSAGRMRGIADMSGFPDDGRKYRGPLAPRAGLGASMGGVGGALRGLARPLAERAGHGRDTDRAMAFPGRRGYQSTDVPRHL